MKFNPDRIRAKLEDIAGAVRRLERFQTVDRGQFIKNEDSQDIARII